MKLIIFRISTMITLFNYISTLTSSTCRFAPFKTNTTTHIQYTGCINYWKNNYNCYRRNNIKKYNSINEFTNGAFHTLEHFQVEWHRNKYIYNIMQLLAVVKNMLKFWWNHGMHIIYIVYFIDIQWCTRALFYFFVSQTCTLFVS